MTMILLSDQEAATNADILANTRLQNAPANGVLTFEMQASDNDATNNFTATIQLPDGDVPINAQRIPTGGSAGLPGVLDEREALIMSLPVTIGGHTVFSCVETGTTEFTWRVTFNSIP